MNYAIGVLNDVFVFDSHGVTFQVFKQGGGIAPLAGVGYSSPS